MVVDALGVTEKSEYVKGPVEFAGGPNERVEVPTFTVGVIAGHCKMPRSYTKSTHVLVIEQRPSVTFTVYEKLHGAEVPVPHGSEIGTLPTKNPD